MQNLQKTVVVILALTLVSCGGDSSSVGGNDDFEGTYEVSSYTSTDDAGCNAAAVDTNPDRPFFRLTQKAFEGTEPYLQFTWCKDAKVCDSDVLFAGWFFDTKSGNTWSGDAFIELKKDTEGCQLRIDTNEATLAGESNISLEKESHLGTVDPIEGMPCEEDGQTEEVRAAYVDAYRDSSALSCVNKDTITGVKS